MVFNCYPVANAEESPMSSQNPTTVAWWSVRMRATGTLDDEPYHVSGAESLVAPGMIEIGRAHV